MSNLFASLVTAADALNVFERGLNTVQNNILNASTPGYAKQRLTLEAQRFEPHIGTIGGVRAGPMFSYRERYAELAVRRQFETSAFFGQRADSLARIESVFDVKEGSGLPAALNRLFQNFSELSVAPNNLVSRQVAIDSARDLAAQFNQSARNLTIAGSSTKREIDSTVAAINEIAGRIRAINQERHQNAVAPSEAASDTAIHNLLEELSSLANYTAIDQPDGSVSVYLGGQTLLVVGDRSYKVEAGDYNGAKTVLDFQGNEIQGTLQGGKLAALLDYHNRLLPSYLGDLNTIAKSLADNVNTTLSLGLDRDGGPPSTDLFSYNDTHGAAYTLAVKPILPEQLALALPPNPGGNGNVLKLVDLGQAKLIDGFSLTDSYGLLGGRVGSDLATARESDVTQEQFLNQARSLRADIQNVSLDEEAAYVIRFQKAYQAGAQLIKTINEMTDAIFNTVR